MTIDYEKLRADLIDYYGTAGATGMPAAFLEAINVKTESDAMLLERAQQNGLDLSNYTNLFDISFK